MHRNARSVSSVIQRDHPSSLRQCQSFAANQPSFRQVPRLAVSATRGHSCREGLDTRAGSSKRHAKGDLARLDDRVAVLPSASRPQRDTGFPWVSKPKLWRLAAAVACLTIATGNPAKAAEAGGFSPAGVLKGLLSFVLHLDVHLGQIIAQYGAKTYAILFGIVFCETGLVVTPFLPGDSLLFASGAFASLGHLSVPALLATFISSAILGDFVNYQLGQYFGNKAKTSRLVKQEYLEKTEAFYEKYGGKTVVLARFIPIVRTFAPFVAGVGAMSFQKFTLYNIGGAVLWSVLFVGAGALLGNVPAVKHNFSIVIFAIIGISLLPVLFEAAAARREGKTA